MTTSSFFSSNTTKLNGKYDEDDYVEMIDNALRNGDGGKSTQLQPRPQRPHPRPRRPDPGELIVFAIVLIEII